MADINITRSVGKRLVNGGIAFSSIESVSKQASEKTNDQLEAESPVLGREGLQQWNRPRINLYRYLATLFGFIVMGVNDSASGVSSDRFAILRTPITNASFF